MKLVQRAGRVDRIGQQAAQVMVYSLMPAPTLEDAITLRRRILDRLRENASLLGSDEQFFGREEERAVIMGLYDEHSDYRLDEEEIDPVSMAYQIWRTAEQKYPDLAEQAKSMPNVVYSTKSAPANAGLVVHSQASLGSDAFAFVPRNGPPRRISPQEALRRSACQPNTTPAPRLTGHFEMIASALRGPLKAPPPEQLMARQGGVIGKCWRRLSRHREILQPNLMFTSDDLDAALNDLHDPRDTALKELSRAIDADMSDDDLAALLVRLRKERLLSRSKADPTGLHKDPQIICSMGLAD